MEASAVKIEPQDIKIEPQDIKTEPELDGGLLPKKKKSQGRPKKLKQEKITDHVTVVKKKHDRFKGMSLEEVASRLLPDHLAPDLDIVIVGINPGLFAAFTGHHYAGPGNHFWKCMYLSGLIPEPMTALQDFKLLDYGIGFTNIVARTTKGSADLTKKEIKEGAVILTEKLLKYKPKIAVFNGKGIYEVFVGHKNFYFGKQPELLPGTETAVFVMPSSSARCSQLPRAVDKVPFYEALKKFRDHLNGKLPNLDDSEICFPDLELKTAVKKEVKKEGYDEINPQEMEAQINQAADSLLTHFTQGNYQVIPHTSASDPCLPNMNGLLVPQVKQEPQDNGAGSTCQTKKSRGPRKKKKNQAVPPTDGSNKIENNFPTNMFQYPNSSIGGQQEKQEGQNHAPDTSCATSVSVLHSPSQSNDIPLSIKQEPPDDFLSTVSEYPASHISHQPSPPKYDQQIQQKTLPSMPPLQQHVRIKQEPEDCREASCTVSQSDTMSYPKYLNPDASDHMSQNSSGGGNQFSSFLQGMYGMVNKVANQQGSNYGMVSLSNQIASVGNQPLQFNEALCDIVKDSSQDMDNYSNVVIKREPEEEKKPKPRGRKRKSDSKPASTITSPTEESESSSSKSPGSVYQGFQPNVTHENNPQHTSPFSHSSQPNPVESYQNPHCISNSQSHNHPSIYSHQASHPYLSDQMNHYQPHFANSNHSEQFLPHMPSFSQMLAQDSDSFRMYPYSKAFHPTHGPMQNMDSAFPGHGYPYPAMGYERWGYPPIPSTGSDQRMPGMHGSAISSHAASDSAVDLTQTVNKSGSNFESKSADDEEFKQNVVVKKEKHDE